MEYQPLSKVNGPDRHSHTVNRAKSPSAQQQPFHVLRQIQHGLGNRLVGRHIQAKLKVSEPGDLHEQEADRVADEVMRMPDVTPVGPSTNSAMNIQRVCAECEEEEDLLQPKHILGPASNATGENLIRSAQSAGSDFAIIHDSEAGTVSRSLESPYSMDEGRIVDDNEETVQAKSAAATPASPVPTASARIDAAVSRPGAALPDSTRSFLESRFRHDFSGVKIHADEIAAEAAESVNARAFTIGDHVVFGRGQYSPGSESGRWLLAHEFTHVVQQASAPSRRSTGSQESISKSTPTITRHGPDATLRRVRWNTARDTGRDSFPWGSGPKGDIYSVQTDAGNIIAAWKPHDGQTYWCHGYTFGGSAASGGPFSIWGQDVPTVLVDDGWKPAYSCVAQRGDALVFAANNVAHSGLVASTYEPGGTVDENASMLDSKWGQAAFNRQSWAINAGQYGRYGVYSKDPAYGPCAGKGANER